ncbi:MAG: hypothetical protein WCA60_06900, partial [Methanoregula sp.]
IILCRIYTICLNICNMILQGEAFPKPGNVEIFMISIYNATRGRKMAKVDESLANPMYAAGFVGRA